MTKEEKAALSALDKRLDTFMSERHLKTVNDVLREMRGKKNSAADLIRAAAKLRLSKTSLSENHEP